MRDGQGIISAVLNGPDQRTRLSADDAPRPVRHLRATGISVADVEAHLDQLVTYVRLTTPQAEIAERLILSGERGR